MTLSLLYPPGAAPPRTDRRWPADALAHLGVEALIRALTPSVFEQRQVRRVLEALDPDPAVIAYRQATLADLVRLPALTAQIDVARPWLAELHAPSYRTTQESAFYQTLWRLAELETYLACVQALGDALETAAGDLRAAGLRALRAHLAERRADPAFRTLAAELPELAARIREVQSVTVGINLDGHLRPSAVTLLAINRQPFRANTVLSRLFGETEAEAGLAPLHPVQREAGQTPADAAELRLSPLFRDLERLLAEAARPIADALARYRTLNVQSVQALAPELAFFVCGARLHARLSAAGLAACLPEPAPNAARLTQLTGLYNLLLALQRLPEATGAAGLVGNDLTLDEAGRIAVLTGPNRGGKTTFTQAVGLAQVLFQAGLPVPAAGGQLSPVDAIHVHFAAEERPHLNTGRLGEEAQRVSAIFQQATAHSLILFNESFSSTTPGEGLYLAQDVVRGLCLLGARGLFVTHFLELAERVADLTPASAPSRAFSLVAGVAEPGADGATPRTFKIQPGPPLGTSYAREIAVQHGISFEQIAAALRQRGLGGG